MTIDPRLRRIVAAQPYPLLFATISGAHLYGFPSPDFSNPTAGSARQSGCGGRFRISNYAGQRFLFRSWGDGVRNERNRAVFKFLTVRGLISHTTITGCG
jgi:hypothetical protein